MKPTDTDVQDFFLEILKPYRNNAQVLSIAFENRCLPSDNDDQPVELLHVDFTFFQSHQHQNINDELDEYAERNF